MSPPVTGPVAPVAAAIGFTAAANALVFPFVLTLALLSLGEVGEQA